MKKVIEKPKYKKGGRKDGKSQTRVYKEKKDIIAFQSQVITEEKLRELSNEEIERRVKKYLDNCGIDWYGNIKGKSIKEMPTLAKLAMYLDVSRQTILNLESKNIEVFGTIKRAKQIIEHLREQDMWKNKNQTGNIFVLKNNHGWKEETQHKNLNVNIDIDDIDTDFSFLAPDNQ